MVNQKVRVTFERPQITREKPHGMLRLFVETCAQHPPDFDVPNYLSTSNSFTRRFSACCYAQSLVLHYSTGL
jgi:hypothetical protein